MNKIIMFKAETGESSSSGGSSIGGNNSGSESCSEAEREIRLNKGAIVDLGKGSQIVYISRFMPPSDSWDLFHYLDAHIHWIRPTLRVFGRSCLQPRDTCYVASEGLPQLTYSGYQPHAYCWDDYPPLKLILDAVHKALPGSSFNSLLLNRYKNGNDCVGWHSDDEKLYGPTPEIASVSFGCERHFLLKKKPARRNEDEPANKKAKKNCHADDDQRSFTLKHGSLLVMRGCTQRDWVHSVPKRAKAETTRINLTFRKDMVGMGLKSRQNSMGSPRSEVGEIDTRAPFQSVRAAVSLFGEGSAHKEKPLVTKMIKPSAERVLVKETQLHLAEKELDKLKNQLKSAENTKTQGLSDLEKAKRTLEDLNSKLNTVSQSKAATTEATQAAKSRAKQLEKAHFQQIPQSPSAWRQELDRERDQYRTASNELGILKLELRKIQQDFDSFLEAKIMAFQQAADAQHAVKNNREKVSELSKDIAAMQESLAHVKLATAKAKEDHRKIVTERDNHQQSHRAAVEDIGKKLQSLNKEFDPEIVTDLEGKLEEVTEEIEVLEAKTKAAKAACLESLRILNLELGDAKMALQMATQEESSLRSVVDSLNLELEGVKKECIDYQVKEAETEIVSRNLQMDVEKGRAELELTVAEELKAREALSEMVSTIQQLLSESRAARLEVEEMKKNMEELNGEVEILGIKTKEVEGKLEVAQGEAAEARAAEKIALEQMKMKDLPWRENASDYQLGNPPPLKDSEDGGKIKLSMEEFESLTRKVEESNTLGESKVETLMAEMEAIKVSENEAAKQLESRLKEIEAMEAATEEALKQAEMAEDAKQAVEKELKRWHEQKHNIMPAASSDS